VRVIQGAVGFVGQMPKEDRYPPYLMSLFLLSLEAVGTKIRARPLSAGFRIRVCQLGR
jgi:hypothetical protein